MSRPDVGECPPARCFRGTSAADAAAVMNVITLMRLMLLNITSCSITTLQCISKSTTATTPLRTKFKTKRKLSNFISPTTTKHM
ncbi:Tyrocidine synthase [Dirofilaria immitis]